ncbi:hypothetical protein COU56_00065 [Candidatus Pacearchaeota archaeon CG10_big_fil_rev_8_21_14_0_10_31_9]|nr:MAG: hypothetical protein AUJ62_03350 [Candidatus Pacearchaeota archaeon CG1_02_32_21]PIN96723.1 MAG: hypothetical protein COU56_00065 [Candidatus Pacearchaeota archaeon CG10_big_fil_rev_8_21_14_0_10_31_9]PIZ82936.1 MAG: hypothetical protein COX97_02355 [Candidatus Pacearchaeota archaeon CG_4_10_14_0_2_um_filter_05_32_18]
MKYNIREITPEGLRCIIGGCPAIYEVTPKAMQSIMGGCNSVYEEGEHYLIIGERVEPSEFGLAGKVGEGEVLVQVPKRLIDDRGK